VTRLRALRVPTSAAAFARDQRGVAAVEAAFIFPLMLVVLAIVVVFAQAFEIKRKVAQTARTVTDLVTQYSGVNADQSTGPLELAGLTGDLAAAQGTMEPFSNAAPTATTMVVTEVKADDTGLVGTVQWSKASYNGTARTAGATIALPTGVAAADGYVVLGEASFVYAPAQIWQAAASYTLTSSIYLPPRQLQCITVQTIYPACK
jgi:Flp pilus assembly protein TadG